MAKAFKLNYSTPTNNNQRISSNPRNRQIVGYEYGSRQINADGWRNQVIQNAVQNLRVQYIRNQNGLIGVQGNGNQNQIENGNLVAARAKGNAARQNGNQIRCYNYRGVCHYARNCTVRPRRRDAAYLQTQFLIAQKEEAGIQLQAKEYDLMAAVADLDEIEEVNANCILIANLQQASTSGTQTNKAPVYDSDGSAELHENCDDNEIFNMFTQEEQYTELLEPIFKSYQVPQNDNNIISEARRVDGRINSSQMDNNIMAAGFRDRPPMLAPGRYPQWCSRFLRYVDTRPNGEALRKCILSSPYKPTTVLVYAVEATDNSLAVTEHTTVETPANMSSENKAHFLAEKEAIHLILTGIRDDIYSTVDACQTAHKMWEAIKRFYKLMNEMIRNNLTVTTMQVNFQFLQQLQPEWSRFVTIVKQQHKLNEVSYHKLFDILKQYQNEVNELRTEKLARNANPLALVVTAQASQDQYYQTSRSHKSSAPSRKPLIPSRSQTTTRHKGKKIAKPITPSSETASEEDSNPEQAQRDKDMQKNLALIAKYFKKIYKPTNNKFKTSSNSKNKNVDTTPRYKNDDHSRQFETQRTVNIAGTREKVGSQVVQKIGIQCFNCKEYGHFAKECKNPKRVKDSAYHKEKILLYKKAEQGVPLQAEQYDWLADTDEEVDEQELKAHYSYMAKILKVPTADSGTDSEPVEHVQDNAGYNVFANHP
nr:hypothetical protein [Tanacetum cinerariifolium]